MIHMPRRSVTRFFIPLIDVLFLMFSMFLLLPFMKPSTPPGKDLKEYSREELEKLGQSLEKQLADSQELLAANKRAREQLERQVRDLHQRVLDLKPTTDAARELAKLREEVRDLRHKKIEALERMQLVRVLEIDPKNGKLFCYEPGFPLKKQYVTSEEDAVNLVNRDKQRLEAQGRELFYLFRFSVANPELLGSNLQTQRYLRWFKDAGVATGVD